MCYVTHCLKACWCSFINLTMTILVLEHIWTRGWSTSIKWRIVGMFVCLFLLTLWWIGYLSKVNCASCPVTGESGRLLKNQKGDSLNFGDSLKWPCEELQLFKIHYHLQMSNFTIERDISVQSDTTNGCFIKKPEPPHKKRIPVTAILHSGHDHLLKIHTIFTQK